MEAALGWFGAIFKWLGRFLPRWMLIRAGHRAIKWLPGGRTRVLKPGIAWWWPVTTEVTPHPVVRQVLNSNSQTLMTKDGIQVYVSGIVIYAIIDLHRFMVENFDALDSLDDVLQTAIRKVVVAKTFAQLQEGRARLDGQLTREAQRSLEAFGVEVEAARLTDFSQCAVHNIVGGSVSSVSFAMNPVP